MSEPHDPIGLTVAPTHYAGERETIDLIRDFLTARGFLGFCKGNAIKYLDRASRKGGAEDLAMAEWYTRMALHLQGFGPDPRAHRPDFKPYKRPSEPMPREAAVSAFCDLYDRLQSE